MWTWLRRSVIAAAAVAALIAVASGADAAEKKESGVTLANTSDAGIVGAFGSSDVTALVTWNPQVSGIQFPGGQVLGNPQNVKMRFSPEYMKDGRRPQAVGGASTDRKDV